MPRSYPASKDVWPAASFYAGKSFSEAGSTQWPADVGDQFEAIQDFVGYTSDAAGDPTINGRLKAVESIAAPTWSDYTPHIYYNTSGASYTEITYGTGAVIDAWYRSDGYTVDFVQQIRIGTDADLGPDGKALAISLPVEADTTLGNTYAVAINAQVTLGVALFNHLTDVSLHAGRVGDLNNGNFAYFVATGGLALTNTSPCYVVDDGAGTITPTALTSDGNASTGWHDFHVAGRYRAA